MNIAEPTKQYHHGTHAIYSCQYHVVWCPKYRRKVLVNGIDETLKQLILEKQNDYGYTIIEMEIMPDHVHLLIDTNPSKNGIETIVRKIKGYTSHELRQRHPELKSRIPNLWTRSKFISTVGTVSLATVKRYIENQKNV